LNRWQRPFDNLIRIAKSTQFHYLNFIREDNYLKDLFTLTYSIKKDHANCTAFERKYKRHHRKITKKDYHHFKTKEDIFTFIHVGSTKICKSGLIHEFRDNDQIIGFIGLYNRFFQFRFCHSDTALH